MAPTRLKQKNMGGSGENGSDQCAHIESGVFLVQMFKKNVVHVFCFHFRHLFQGGESIFLFEQPIMDDVIIFILFIATKEIAMNLVMVSSCKMRSLVFIAASSLYTNQRHRSPLR